MKKALALVVACALGSAAFAGPITPFSFYAGYFTSASFHNHAGNSINVSGLELGAQDSIISLPIIGSAVIGASVVLGDSLGGSATGTLYRGYLDYKTPTIPGSSFYAMAGVGYYYASGDSFSSHGGVGTELGIGLPVHILPVGPSFAIEARYQWGRAATSGLGVGLHVSF